MIGRFFRWIFRYIVNLIIRIIVNYLIAIPIMFVVGVGLGLLFDHLTGKELVLMNAITYTYNIILNYPFLKWIPLVLAFFPNLLTLEDFKKGGGGCSNNYYWL